MAANIRVAPAARAALSETARTQSVSLTEPVSRAVAAYHRAAFLEGMAREFEALRRDPAAWAQEGDDRMGWDATLADRLRGEPAHPDARVPTAHAADAPPRRRARRR